MNSSFEQAFDSELLPNERILWSGQPSTSVIFRRSDWFAIPFSFLWGGFALFWEGGVTHAYTDFSNFFFTLWGVPFIVIGQYMIWGRFLYTAWLKRRTFYALTSFRVLVRSNGFARKRVDCAVANLNTITFTEGPGNFGSIEFTPDPTRDSYSSRRQNGTQLGIDLSRLAFFDIPDASDVYRLLQQERQRLGAASVPSPQNGDEPAPLFSKRW